MKKNNILFANKMSKTFNKKSGVITYSGTLSIESALHCLDLEENSKILVSSNVCYSIINTILKLHLLPIIVDPENDLFLTEKDIDSVLKEHNIECILLVHQYGLLNNINNLKYKQKGIKIIEDVAQAWKIESDNYNVGVDSDFVVTSFGATKPLSYGIGGGIFFDDLKYLDYFDFCDNTSRESNQKILSYVYSKCNEIDYQKLISNADNIIDEQRSNAQRYFELFKDSNFINCISVEDNVGFTWHRFPIWIDEELEYNRFLEIIKNSNLKYQLPHDIKLTELQRYNDCIIMSKKNHYKHLILLRTRYLDIKMQLEELKKCIKYYKK